MTANILTPPAKWGDRKAGGLPEFLIIGAQKAGTTALYRYLIQHPDVFPPLRKEVHYFDVRYPQGLDWYRSFFPDLASDVAASDGMRRPLTCEATPYYLFHPHVPRRVAAVLPGAKLVTILRNPIDRAYSHYQMQIQMGSETLRFEEAIEAEESRVDGESSRLLADETYRSDPHILYSYLARGRYIDQLLRWEACFPQSQILVLKADDLKDDRKATVDKVLDFLGLPHRALDMTELAHSRQYSPLSPALRERLGGYFEPHNRRLYAHLGVDFEWQ